MQHLINDIVNALKNVDERFYTLPDIFSRSHVVRGNAYFNLNNKKTYIHM